MSDYLDGYAITGGRLTTLAAPATLFTWLDDSIIDATDLARRSRTVSRNSDNQADPDG